MIRKEYIDEFSNAWLSTKDNICVIIKEDFDEIEPSDMVTLNCAFCGKEHYVSVKESIRSAEFRNEFCDCQKPTGSKWADAMSHGTRIEHDEVIDINPSEESDIEDEGEDEEFVGYDQLVANVDVCKSHLVYDPFIKDSIKIDIDDDGCLVRVACKCSICKNEIDIDSNSVVNGTVPDMYIKDMPNRNNSMQAPVKAFICPKCMWSEGENITIKKKISDIRKFFNIKEHPSTKFKNFYRIPAGLLRFYDPTAGRVVEYDYDEFVQYYHDALMQIDNDEDDQDIESEPIDEPDVSDADQQDDVNRHEPIDLSEGDLTDDDDDIQDPIDEPETKEETFEDIDAVEDKPTEIDAPKDELELEPEPIDEPIDTSEEELMENDTNIEAADEAEYDGFDVEFRDMVDETTNAFNSMESSDDLIEVPEDDVIIMEDDSDHEPDYFNNDQKPVAEPDFIKMDDSEFEFADMSGSSMDDFEDETPDDEHHDVFDDFEEFDDDVEVETIDGFEFTDNTARASNTRGGVKRTSSRKSLEREGREEDALKATDMFADFDEIVHKSGKNPLDNSVRLTKDFNSSNFRKVMDVILGYFVDKSGETIKHKLTINRKTLEYPVLDFITGHRIIFVDLDLKTATQVSVEKEVSERLPFSYQIEGKMVLSVIYSDMVTSNRAISITGGNMAKIINFRAKTSKAFKKIRLKNYNLSYTMDDVFLDDFALSNSTAMRKPRTHSIGMLLNFGKSSDLSQRDCMNLMRKGEHATYSDIQRYPACSCRFILNKELSGHINSYTVTITDYIEDMSNYVTDGLGLLIGAIKDFIKKSNPREFYQQITVFYEHDRSSLISPSVANFIGRNDFVKFLTSADQKMNDVINDILRSNGFKGLPNANKLYTDNRFNLNYWPAYVQEIAFRKNASDNIRKDWRIFTGKSLIKYFGSKFTNYVSSVPTSRDVDQFLKNNGYHVIAQLNLWRYQFTSFLVDNAYAYIKDKNISELSLNKFDTNRVSNNTTYGASNRMDTNAMLMTQLMSVYRNNNNNNIGRSVDPFANIYGTQESKSYRNAKMIADVAAGGGDQIKSAMLNQMLINKLGG